MKSKKNDEILVSILVLTYNNIEGLDKTIKSIIEQSYGNIEVLISDDGSNKFEPSELDKYAERLIEKTDNVQVHYGSDNVGTVKHLNRVISQANGEYLIPCSSGDFFYNADTISKIVFAMRKRHSLISVGRRMDKYQDGKKKSKPAIIWGIVLELFPQVLLKYMVKKRNVFSGCSVCYSKVLFEKYGKFDERFILVEDYPYFVKLLKQKIKINYINQNLVYHEIGGVSTGNVHPQVIKDIELLKSEN